MKNLIRLVTGENKLIFASGRGIMLKGIPDSQDSILPPDIPPSEKNATVIISCRQWGGSNIQDLEGGIIINRFRRIDKGSVVAIESGDTISIDDVEYQFTVD